MGGAHQQCAQKPHDSSPKWSFGSCHSSETNLMMLNLLCQVHKYKEGKRARIHTHMIYIPHDRTFQKKSKNAVKRILWASFTGCYSIRHRSLNVISCKCAQTRYLASYMCGPLSVFWWVSSCKRLPVSVRHLASFSECPLLSILSWVSATELLPHSINFSLRIIEIRTKR